MNRSECDLGCVLPRVVTIGLSHLQVAGLRQIGGGEWEVTSNDGKELISDGDCWIITPEEFVANVDFFNPRRNRVLVLSDSKSSFPFCSITRSASESEIKSAIQHILSLTQETIVSHRLSPRELEVLAGLAKGMTAKEIGDSLYISVNTVTTHRKNISSKLGIRSVSGLTLYAMMNGII